MTFDHRTRTADDIGAVDARHFHAETIPGRLAANGALAARVFRASPLDAMTVAVEGDAWTWQLDESGSLEVIDGDTGEGPRADLDPEWFEDIVNDVRSTTALMIADIPVMARGKIFHLIEWEPTFKALLDGRPGYEPGLIDFVDRDGAPLDLTRSFTVDDDPADIAWFLDQAGFLHVRGVFTPDEMTILDAEIDRWRAQMTPDDNRAWYATAGDEQVCVRVTNLPKGSVDFPQAEDRLAFIGALADDDRRYGGMDLLVKPVSVTEGISDLPWHKDCELGGHSYRCSGFNCGTSVTASGSDNGQLGVVAGSHRINISMLDVDRVDLPQMFLTTEVGDITVHQSCALHCATPPVHSERRVTYSGFGFRGSNEELDAKVRAVRDQAGRETYAPT